MRLTLNSCIQAHDELMSRDRPRSQCGENKAQAVHPWPKAKWTTVINNRDSLTANGNDPFRRASGRCQMRTHDTPEQSGCRRLGGSQQQLSRKVPASSSCYPRGGLKHLQLATATPPTQGCRAATEDDPQSGSRRATSTDMAPAPQTSGSMEANRERKVRTPGARLPAPRPLVREGTLATITNLALRHRGGQVSDTPCAKVRGVLALEPATRRGRRFHPRSTT